MRRLATALAVAATAALAIAPVASAKGHDDAHAHRVAHWEHRFHFKLTKANRLADPDHDGVTNEAECQHGTNPRSNDTNHDGRHDGNDDRNHNGVADDRDPAAKVKSFTPATATAPAMLVIALPDGTTETGAVTAATELRCETAPVVTPPTTPAAPATTRDHGDGNDNDRGNGNDNGDNSGPGSDNSGPGNANDNRDNDNDNDENPQPMCTTASLTVGAVIHEAELRITPSGAVFHEIELLT